MTWLLKEEVLQAVVAGRRSGMPITADRAKAFDDLFAPTAEGMPRNLRVAGDTAEIRVEGVLTKKPDFWSWLFGGGNTTYEQIQQALAICAADPSIKRVRFYVDSPGGHVDGLFDTLAAIDAFGKPKSVTAAYACSAAYAIAAVGGKIEVTNAAVEVGSIGVAIRYFLDEDQVDITSTEAPNKRPDPSTEEGRAVIRKVLDDIHDLFADAIAHGRGTTKARVNAEFGRGGTMLAVEAKKRGMIDRIAKPALRAVNPSSAPAEPDPKQGASEEDAPEPTASPAPSVQVDDSVTVPVPTNPTAFHGGSKERRNAMTKEDLKAQHPALYASVLEEGVATERDRVVGHLTMGEASGDMKTATEAIKDGSGMTVTINAKYLSASMNRRDRDARQADSDAAGAALDGARPNPGKPDGATPGGNTNLVDLFAADLPAKKRSA